MKVKVRVSEIDYDISAEDVLEFDLPEGADEELIEAQIQEIKSGLPQELEVEVDVEPGDDLAYEVCEAISNETGWLVNWFAGEVIE